MIEKKVQICSNCILPEGFLGIQLNSEKKCNFCCDSTYKNVNWYGRTVGPELKNKYLEEWNRIIESAKNNGKDGAYDCVLGFSGGKDSTALLDYLINDIGLKVLAVTVDIGFMPDIAKENIKKTLDQLNFAQHHLLIEDAIPTFTKLYKYLFLNHKSNEVLLSRKVCDYCCDLLHSIVVKEAVKRKIPYVFFGYSPDQIFRYFFEIPRNEIANVWRPKLIEHQPFDENDKKWYLSYEDINNNAIPRVILPYHVLEYKEKSIVERVESKNLISKGHADPLLTNCDVIPATAFYDLNRYGGMLYALQYAELVRQNPSIRKKWLITLKQVVPLILKNKYKEKPVNDFFQKIGVSIEQIRDVIDEHLKRDPQKDRINSVIRSFSKNKN